MRPTLFNPTMVLFTSILCSLLFHWAAFTNLVLVWPAFKETPKPMIVFLGSILQSSNMDEQVNTQEAPSIPLHHLAKIKDPSPLYTGSVDKPWQQSLNDPKKKRTLKSADNLRHDDEIPAETTPLAVDDFEIEMTIEPYKPLRLKDSD